MLKLRSRSRKSKAVTQEAPGEQSTLQEALSQIQSAAATGRLSVVTHTGARADLFAFEGALYAVELMEYQPPVDVRMRSGGLIDSVQFDQLADLEPQGSPARRGRLAAARQLLSIEALGSIHHEFVLAAFGATQDARVVSTTFTEGSATSEVCAMPIPLDVLRKAVDIRRARMDADWAEVGGLEHPWNCILDRDGPDLPAECQLPEFIAMHQALDGLRTLAEVAYGCGFTLAEAVRLVSILMKRGLVVALGTSSASATALWVPEMFALFSPPASKESTALASGDQEHEPPGLSEGELRAREDVDAGGTHDVEAGRTSGVDLALRQALREELSRTEEHAVSIREQLAQLEHLERLGAVPADA